MAVSDHSVAETTKGDVDEHFVGHASWERMVHDSSRYKVTTKGRRFRSM